MADTQIQFVYDESGRPTSVILPFDLFSKLAAKRKDLADILKTSSRIARKSKIQLKDLLSTLKNVRGQLFRERYT